MGDAGLRVSGHPGEPFELHHIWVVTGSQRIGQRPVHDQARAKAVLPLQGGVIDLLDAVPGPFPQLYPAGARPLAAADLQDGVHSGAHLLLHQIDISAVEVELVVLIDAVIHFGVQARASLPGGELAVLHDFEVGRIALLIHKSGHKQAVGTPIGILVAARHDDPQLVVEEAVAEAQGEQLVERQGSLGDFHILVGEIRKRSLVAWRIGLMRRFAADGRTVESSGWPLAE